MTSPKSKPERADNKPGHEQRATGHAEELDTAEVGNDEVGLAGRPLGGSSLRGQEGGNEQRDEHREARPH